MAGELVCCASQPERSGPVSGCSLAEPCRISMPLSASPMAICTSPAEELDTAQAALDSGLWDATTYSSHVAALQLGRKEELQEMEEVAQFCPQLPFNASGMPGGFSYLKQ